MTVVGDESELLNESVELEMKLEDSVRGGRGKSINGVKDLVLRGDIRGERIIFCGELTDCVKEDGGIIPELLED